MLITPCANGGTKHKTRTLAFGYCVTAACGFHGRAVPCRRISCRFGLCWLRNCRGKGARTTVAADRFMESFSVDLFPAKVSTARHRHRDDRWPTGSKKSPLFLQHLVAAYAIPRAKAAWWCWISSQSQIGSAQTPNASSRTERAPPRTGRFCPADRKNATWPLPEGCFINYDLRFIDFLKSLDNNGLAEDCATLREVLGRRPDAGWVLHRAGAAFHHPPTIRQLDRDGQRRATKGNRASTCRQWADRF